MLKAITLITVILLSSSLLIAQNFEKQFKDLSAKRDTSGQVKLLADWEQASPTDPEMFIAYFNYYVTKSRMEVVSLNSTQKDNSGFVVTDTGTGKPVAFLNASTKYRSDVLQKGFDYINKGIAVHPRRLDMRFGKIYMLGEAENYTAFTKEIISTIDEDEKMQHNWLWKAGKPLETPGSFFLNSLQDYITTIYNTEEDDLLPLMRQISEAVIKYHPNHVESLSNIALTYLVVGDYDNALRYLLQAEQIAPKDVIVLNNIAEAYKRKNDKQNAKAYYEKIVKYGNKEESNDARQKIKNL